MQMLHQSELTPYVAIACVRPCFRRHERRNMPIAQAGHQPANHQQLLCLWCTATGGVTELTQDACATCRRYVSWGTQTLRFPLGPGSHHTSPHVCISIPANRISTHAHQGMPTRNAGLSHTCRISSCANLLSQKHRTCRVCSCASLLGRVAMTRGRFPEVGRGPSAAAGRQRTPTCSGRGAGARAGSVRVDPA